MAGMDSTGGSVLPFSQFRTVHELTPRKRAASFWVSLRVRRQRLTRSPKVWGSKSVSFGFNALSVIPANCKRATRPCPCGFLGHFSGRCKCSPDTVARYRSRISGPLLDRIDLHVEVPALKPGDLATAKASEPSAAIRARVTRARQRQLERQGRPNARVAGHEIASHAAATGPARKLLASAASCMGLSARAHHRVLKVARTIADLDGRAAVAGDDVAEALSYRGAVPTS